MSKRGHTMHTSRAMERIRNDYNNVGWCFDCGHTLTENESGGIWCTSCHNQTHVRNQVALSRKSRGVKDWYAPVVNRPYEAMG